MGKNVVIDVVWIGGRGGEVGQGEEGKITIMCGRGGMERKGGYSSNVCQGEERRGEWKGN